MHVAERDAVDGREPMATTRRTSAAHEPGPRRTRPVDYPTSDGKPLAETELHGRDMMDVILTLKEHFAADPDVYVWGNMLMFYEEGNRRKHLAPDVFFVRGVSKLPPRDYYLLWEEGKPPDAVIEITSKTTRHEDQNEKLVLYRDVLKVPEYFQFDPTEDYLDPPLQGYRLVAGQYVPIAPVEGRLPSAFLGLHLERRGTELRLWDPVNGRTLSTPAERVAEATAARQRAEEQQRQAEEQRQRAEEQQRRAEQKQRRSEQKLRRAEVAQQRAEQERQRVEQENERLRKELEALRRNPPPSSN
jgi:Uma2 family endonuclease